MKKVLNIWLQPVYARLNCDSKKSLFFVLALFPVCGEIMAALLYFFGTQHAGLEIFGYALLTSIAALIAIVFFVWFVMLAQNIGLQYSPANAGLVPQFRKYLQAAIIIPVVFCALLSLIGSRIGLHQYSMWPSFLCVLVMMFLVIIIRTQWAVIPMILCFQIPAIFERAGMKRIDKIIEDKLGLPVNVILLLAMPLIIYAGMRWIFSSRDDALFKMHKRSVALKAGMAGGRTNENIASLSLASLYLRWMKYCIARSQRPGSQEPAVRLNGFALGPRLHWMTITLQVVAMLVLGIAALFLMDTFFIKKSEDFVKGFAVGFGGILLIAQPLFFCILLFYTLYQTRGEQALFSLTARSQSNAMQDAVLTRYLLRQFFVLYGMSISIAGAGTYWVLDGGIKTGSLLLFVTCLFPLVLCIVCAHAKMRTVNDHPMLKILFACLVVFGVGMILQLWGVASLIWWYCALIMISTFLVLMRKLNVNRNSTLFPVGRAA